MRESLLLFSPTDRRIYSAGMSLFLVLKNLTTICLFVLRIRSLLCLNSVILFLILGLYLLSPVVLAVQQRRRAPAVRRRLLLEG